MSLEDLNLDRSLYKKNRIKDTLPILDYSALYDDDNTKPADNVKAKEIKVTVDDNLQDNIDKVHLFGGGVVALENGTHKPGGDITLYSNVYLRGANFEACIIDFENNAYGIKVKGSNGYSTGTVSVTNGGTTVTGGGTTFTSAMVGRNIFLDGLWYPISAFTDTTHVTIGLPFAGVALSGVDYAIATIIYDVRIDRIKIVNSSQGIQAQYANQFYTNYTDIQTSVVCYDLDYCSNMVIKTSAMIACATFIQVNNCGKFIFYGLGGFNTTSGNGIEMTDCVDAALDGNYIVNCVGDGMKLTDSTNISIGSSAFTENGGQGIELVSGNSSITVQGCGFRSNASDGIKLTGTSDNCMINASSFENNGGWGINVAAADCDNNNIRNNVYDSNSSGDYTDSGTNTKTDLQITNGITDYAASDTLQQSADTARTTNSITPAIKLKEIEINFDGTVRVKFALRTTVVQGGNSVYARIYKNGVALGTTRSDIDGTLETYSEDLTFQKDDLIQLYGWIQGGSVVCEVSNFRIYYDEITVAETIVNTD